MNKQAFSKSLILIGAGYWGKNLARNFHALGALHTICDTNESLLDNYEKLYPGVGLTTNFKAALENPLIAQVAIAAPAFLHYTLAKQALLAGKDVYVEKPLCMNTVEADELIQIAEKKRCILMVGHLLQYHPCIQHLQGIVGTGELGKLQYIVSNRLNLGSYRTEENALWNFAPHDISVILSLAGHQLPEQVRCVGAAYLSQGIADTTMTTMRFPGDLRAHIYVSWLNPFKEQKLTVVGSAGMVVFDDTKPWGEKLVLYRDHVTWSNGKIPIANKVIAEKIDPPEKEPLREECSHFLRCCQERIKPHTDGHEGLRVLKVLQAAQASANEDGEGKCPIKEHHLSLEGKRYFSDPSAVIESGAEIGANSKIWHFSHIMKGAKLGPSCNIGQNVVICGNVTLGSNVKVQNNVSIYSGVICEDDVFLGPSMVFTNIVNPRSAVVRKGQYLSTIVRKGATIGANATIVCGVELGEYCFVGAGAVVTKNVKPYALIVGNPGHQIGWMSRHGERLDLPVTLVEGREMTAVCPSTGEEYLLQGDKLRAVEKKNVLTKDR